MNARVANWDDLRVFLTVARSGNPSGAARSLGVNHSTVFRRIAGFETALVGRRVGRLDFAIYGAPAYCAVCMNSDLAQQDWVGLDSAHALLSRFLEQFLPGVRLAVRSNSLACTVRLARAGLGLAILPCVIADQKSGLIRVAEGLDRFGLDLWLLTHEDLRHTARIRAVLDFLATTLVETLKGAGKSGTEP